MLVCIMYICTIIIIIKYYIFWFNNTNNIVHTFIPRVFSCILYSNDNYIFQYY